MFATSGSPIHILLVEDNPTDADLVRQVIMRSKQHNLKISCVERLREAIEICQNQNFDVVLLDLSLPDSDYSDTVANFLAKIENIPIVVLAAPDSEALGMEALIQGAQDYLVKDQITIQIFLRTVRYAIERGKILQQLKKSEQSLIRAEAEAVELLIKEKELNRLRTNFIRIVSHEFRLPLTTVLLASDVIKNAYLKLHKMLGSEPVEERLSRRFSRIETSVKRMVQLLDDMMMVTTSDSGHLKSIKTYIDLEKFCSTLIEALPIEDNDEKCSHINFTCPVKFEALIDPNLLQYVLTNLLANALKYSPPQSMIDFNVLHQDDFAVFEIKDRGIGIPVQDQSQLFELFHRASNVGGIKGTGLGLSIVKKCVEAHGGQISFVSQENQGSTFTVKIPLPQD